MFRRYLIAFILVTLASFSIAHASITGKVIGVSDGDTITVLQDRTQHKIRLYGVDCPEKSQDFGRRAKQFTSNMVFGKTVQVIPEDTDRYGRTVGTVLIGGEILNEELIKAGYAWVYPQYCKKPVCEKWKRYEEAASIKGAGLWSQPHPIPPWEFRKGAKRIISHEQGTGLYHGNIKSMTFHAPGCKAYNCKNCIMFFHNRDEAIRKGYRPCGMCRP